MTQLRDLFDESAGPTPPSALDADAVYAAGRRRRSLMATGKLAAATLTVMVVGSAAYGSAQFATRPNPPIDGAGVGLVTAIAFDGDHVYADTNACPSPPPAGPSASRSPGHDPSGSGPPPAGPRNGPPGDKVRGPLDPQPCFGRLMTSDDGGRHWQARPRPVGFAWLAAPAPGVVAVTPVWDATDQPRISTDGARTWRTVFRTGTAVPQVPAGGWAIASDTGRRARGVVLGVDPKTARAAPLATQPALDVRGVGSIPAKGIIVALSRSAWDSPVGVKPLTFAISRDNGRTWSPTRSSPGGTQEFVMTIDGVNLYAMGQSTSRGQRVHSSNDGGATWRLRTLPDRSSALEGSYVATDGTHIVATMEGDRSKLWASRDGGASYQPVDGMNGLPANSWVSVSTLSQGDYLARVTFDDPWVFYHSVDGWNWKRIAVG